MENRRETFGKNPVDRRILKNTKFCLIIVVQTTNVGLYHVNYRRPCRHLERYNANSLEEIWFFLCGYNSILIMNEIMNFLLISLFKIR